MEVFDSSSLQQKIDNLNKPKGSLGRLEELAYQIGVIQQTLSPRLCHPVHLLLGADHGIEHEDVSVSPRCITCQQMINFTRGGGGVNMFCRQHGFDLRLVDVGVDYDLSAYPQILSRKVAPHGTANFRYGAAMSEAELQRCFDIGRELVDAAVADGSNIISVGEMGIANTSPSSIWMSLLLDLPLEKCVGAGAGLNSEGIRHKLDVLRESMERFKESGTLDILDGEEQAHEVLRYFGGFEMAVATAVMLRAVEKRIILLVDGFIMTACALMASRLVATRQPDFLDRCIFCHSGDESGHRLMLDKMGVKPLLSLGLRLGEGTGALCAFPIVDSAVRMLNEMGNFKDNEITKYF
ncbi:MAG: nicotinate-nucleotide--dimethylbenzimidazole phosphoribosyltransferase [Bacteroidales bacterium]|nr:nicotinate-nucleotide--dimethylbenzimidazole phosphoribosyltransferase [Bacteroidales bacterium]